LVGTVEKIERMIGPFDFVAGMMREEPADGEDEEETAGRQSDAPTREMLPEEPVGRSAEKPQCTERMGEEHERDEEEGHELEFRVAAPDEGEAQAGQCDGKIVVHEAHVEDEAVGEHGEERREEPGRAVRSNGDEGEEAPEKEEDAKGDGDFFSGSDAEEIGERKEQEIEENVMPLPDGVHARGNSLLDELGDPGVVDVAAEVTGFDVGMPEDGDEKKGGEENDSGLHRIGESIARVGKEKECKSERVKKCKGRRQTSCPGHAAEGKSKS